MMAEKTCRSTQVQHWLSWWEICTDVLMLPLQLWVKQHVFTLVRHKLKKIKSDKSWIVLLCRSTAGCRSLASFAGGPAPQSGRSTQHQWMKRCSGERDRAAGTLWWSRSLWILSVRIIKDTSVQEKQIRTFLFFFAGCRFATVSRMYSGTYWQATSYLSPVWVCAEPSGRALVASSPPPATSLAELCSVPSPSSSYSLAALQGDHVRISVLGKTFTIAASVYSRSQSSPRWLGSEPWACWPPAHKPSEELPGRTWWGTKRWRRTVAAGRPRHEEGEGTRPPRALVPWPVRTPPHTCALSAAACCLSPPSSAHHILTVCEI